ncbi:MAG: GatB/YqeY domain-containing protein [Lachnospiraceae bacterium]|nr:GatB/YqeY domain-containing protein [Lachnospiraceae bacterium]
MEFQTLQKDMIAAMKAKDKTRKDAISALVSAAKKTAIDEGVRDNITEEIVNRVILKELKTVKEQIDSCPPERTELRAEYQARYDILQEYAPKMMSEEEVKAFILEKFADLAATKNKGQIMKQVMGELKGKADGRVINQVVTDLCK